MIGNLYPEWGAQLCYDNIQILDTLDENEGTVGQITTRSMKRRGKKDCQCVEANLPHQFINSVSPSGASINLFGVPVKRDSVLKGATVNPDEEYSKRTIAEKMGKCNKCI